jgi:hypothetical protein
MFPIRVGLNRLIAFLMIGVAGLNLYVFLLTGKGMHAGLAGLFALIGVLYLFGNLLVVTETEVQLKNPMGMTVKSYPIQSLRDLEMDGNKLFVTGAGERKKIAGLGFAAAGGDVARLRRAIDDARAGRPA